MDKEFESPLARELYYELSALIDVRRIRKRYITDRYIWRLWKKVYKERCGCTRIFIEPDDKK